MEGTHIQLVNDDNISNACDKEIPNIGRRVKTNRTKKTNSALKKKCKITKRYFTSGFGIDDSNQVSLEKEPSPFAYPSEIQNFGYKVMTKAWREEARVENLKKKYNEKLSYSDSQKKNLLNRLYVKEPKTPSMKTVRDINPNYFKIVSGRPIYDKLNVRDYVLNIREILRLKVITGYKEDEILAIDENLKLEQRKLDQIKANLQTYVNAFEEFLFIDHTSSMKILNESETQANLAAAMYEEYKLLAKELALLRSTLYLSEEKWRNLKMYQKFLYLISPISWRREHDYYFTEQEQFQSTESTDNIFGRYRLRTNEEDYSLIDLIDQFAQDLKLEDKPILYFTDPNQLLDVFRFMEIQNLNSLLHSEELAIPLENLKEEMELAEEAFNVEIKKLQGIISRLEGGILWEEKRAAYLEQKSMGLIENEFKKLVTDEEVLSLHVFVEDCYESRIGPNDANLPVGEMMKAIEARYRNELLLMDKMPTEQVLKLEGNVYLEETKILRRAVKAAKQYADFERLSYRLMRAFAPPYEKSGKELKKRSPPINPPKIIPPPPRPLTDLEYEHLIYFTDYCIEDDLKKYGIYVEDKEDQINEASETPAPKNVWYDQNAKKDDDNTNN